MNKQTLIDDYKQTIERLQKECTEKTDFNIKLIECVQELEFIINRLSKEVKAPYTLDDLITIEKLEQKYNAQFAEMEEKLTAEEMNNFELKEKLKIAEEFIEFLAGGKCSSDVCKLQSREYKNCLACFENKAQQALQKINEVNQ